MTRRIPPELVRRPFTLTEAREAGLSRDNLRNQGWKRIAPSTYAQASAPVSALQLLGVTAKRLPPEAAFSRHTAGWLHGLPLDPCSPIDVTVPAGSAVAARAGVRFHRAVLEGEVVRRRGLRTTSIVRTLADLAFSLPLAEAVVAFDAAIHAHAVTRVALVHRARQSAGRKGVVALRKVLDFVDGRAESPMETRLRVSLQLAGLPKPEVQAELHDAAGRFLGRVDLYYPESRLVLEYDGENHRDRRTDDNRRQNRLLASGYRMLRFTAADLADSAALAVQVRSELGRAA